MIREGYPAQIFGKAMEVMSARIQKRQTNRRELLWAAVIKNIEPEPLVALR